MSKRASIFDYHKRMRIRRMLHRGARSYIRWARDYKAVREIMNDKSIETRSWFDGVDYFSEQTGRRVSSIRAYKDEARRFGWKMECWPATKWSFKHAKKAA